MKNDTKLYMCDCCHKKVATTKGCVCTRCGEMLELDCLIDMYGEEDGTHFANVGIFPGDN